MLVRNEPTEHRQQKRPEPAAGGLETAQNIFARDLSEETLHEIFGILLARSPAASVRIEWIPVSPTEILERIEPRGVVDVELLDGFQLWIEHLEVGDQGLEGGLVEAGISGSDDAGGVDFHSGCAGEQKGGLDGVVGPGRVVQQRENQTLPGARCDCGT